MLKNEWVLLSLFLQLPFVFGNHEGDSLDALRRALHDQKNVLSSWDPTLTTPCTWFHITCNSDSQVTRIDLGNAGLSGELIPSGLGDLSSLQYLLKLELATCTFSRVISNQGDVVRASLFSFKLPNTCSWIFVLLQTIFGACMPMLSAGCGP
ncbi:unnamed protein product [Cuscuta epithymum]|uniref:Leucine-rich repeat-containing N-terminal plant-type domain-containing protein n=1 Tax=Cuscuta epithymum TaxID=186058 RepID=A0AAV0E5Q9_9ASTE|nr:unnamed protein product [Cuscuta epithymum]